MQQIPRLKRTRPAHGSVILGLFLAAGLAACDDGDDGGGTQQGTDAAVGGADATVFPDAQPDAQPDAAPVAAVPATGLYLMQIRLVEVGGIEIGFQVDLTSTANPAGGGTIDRLALRAIGAAHTLSDQLLEVTDVAVDAEGAFTLPESTFVLPAAFSPSNSDVEVRFGLAGTVTGPDGFCGIVSGEVVTLEIVLTASTFAAVPYGSEGPKPAAACGDAGPRMYPRAETCPEMVAGVNTIATGELTREYKLFIPAEPATGRPLVLLFNGLGGTAQDMLDDSQMAEFVDDLGFVLIAPEGHEGAGVEWDSLSSADSPDLALFDDLVRCSEEKLGVDPAQIHVAGLSAGGLFSTYLAMYRAEVVASVAVASGGLVAPAPDSTTPVPPFLAAWGGVDDSAFDTNFNTLAMNLLGLLADFGRPAVACDHGQGHVWLPEFTPWMLEFMLAHRLGDDLLYVDRLPATFPDFCTIRR